MIITSDQIKAGRALLGWSQKDLADATNLARRTIALIETGDQEPGLNTIKKIVSIFDEEQIEFVASEGVRRKADFVKTYTGAKEAEKFFDFILEHTQKTMQPVYLSNLDADEYRRCMPDFFQSNYVLGMTKLGKKIDTKFLVCDGEKQFPAQAYANYRSVPKEQFNASIPFYVFGNYLAIVLFLDEVSVFLIKDKDAVELYREKFLQQWETAKPLG